MALIPIDMFTARQLTPRPTGAILLCLCALLFMAPAGRAVTNTVIFDLGNFGADAVSYKQVRIAPVSPASFPRVEGVTVIGRDYGYKQTDANGRLTNAMVSGTYDITFTNRFLATTFQITVPTTNASGALLASELTTSGTNLPGNLVAYSQSAADGLFAKRTNALSSISTNSVAMYTNGVTNVNWTTGVTGYVANGTAHLGVSVSPVGGSGDAGGTNARQFGTLNLTNWSNIPTGAMANVVSTAFLSNEVANAAVTNAAQTVLISSNTLTINNESNRNFAARVWNTNRQDAALTNNYSGTAVFSGNVGVGGLLGVHNVTFYDFPSAIIATEVDGIVGTLQYSTGLSYDGTTRTLSLSAPLQSLSGLSDPNADRVVFWDDSAGAFAFLTMGANLTITGTTLDAATGGSGEANVNGEISVTNATRIGLVSGKSGVTNLLRSLSPGLNMSLTNEGTNIVIATTASPTFTDVTVSGTTNGMLLLTDIVNNKSWAITVSNVTQNVTNIYATPWPAGQGWCYRIATTNAFLVVWTNGPCTDANLITQSALATSNQFFIQRRITNYAHASSIAVDAGTDVAASVTNFVTGNVSLLITNAVAGMSGRLRVWSDSSARTFSVFSDKLITMLSTNETANSTQLVTTASKRMFINWACDTGTNGTTAISLWAKSQP